MTVLKEAIEAKKVTPVIGVHYPLNVVPGATQHFKDIHARGKIVITVGAVD